MTLCLGWGAKAAERDLVDAAVLGFMGDGGGDRLFYYPTKDAPFTPKKYGYQYEDVHFLTEDKVKLHGWWLPVKKGESAKATVVFSHGNAGSLAYHFVFVHWMVDAGYNVLMYDYRGYGESAGEVSKAGLVRDAQAAFAYAQGRKDVQSIVAYGHSLGGAKSIAAIGLSAPPKLVAVAVDSTFASYQDMAGKIAGAHARKAVSASYAPEDYVQRFPAGMPLLIMHGGIDETIPFRQAQKLYRAAKSPKVLISVPKGNHVNCCFVEDGKYRKLLLDWISEILEKAP